MKLLHIIIIIVLGLVIYSNSLAGRFVWDDYTLVEANTYLRSWSHVPDIFTRDMGSGADVKYYFYRPLQIFIYRLIYSLAKLDVRFYHFANIFFHIGAALCVYGLAVMIFSDSLPAFFTGILFLVHPIQTDAVCYISGIADPLCAVFLLLSSIFYIKFIHCDNNFQSGAGRKRIIFYVLALISCNLALLSKEIGLVFPLILLLCHYTFKKKLEGKYFLPFLIIVFSYLLFRNSIVGNNAPLSFTAAVLRIPGFFAALADYARLLLLPFGLHADYGNKLFSFFQPVTILGLSIVLFLLVLAFKKKNKNNILFFSVMWFFITLLPVSGIYPILRFYMAEHYLYLPSLGFFLIFADILNRACRVDKFKIAGRILIIFLVGFYSYLTVKQNNYWREPVTFYKRTVKYNPLSVRMWMMLGEIYFAGARYDEAEAVFKKVVEINPNHSAGYFTLGNIYARRGQFKDAAFYFEKAIEVNPEHAAAYNNLANLFRQIGRKNIAVSLYKKAIEVDAHLESARANLADISHNLDEPEPKKKKNRPD